MPGRVPEHVVQQIVRATDAVRLIGRYTKLQQRGQRYVGLCPFHKEKTPSFSVDPEQGLYYCFGCKEGGNVFTFLKKVEGLEFYEALQQLAREAGIDISQYRSSSGPDRHQRQNLRSVLELAASFYEKCLQKAGGSETAREYLAGRQISEESIERWRLGYAPDGWEHVLNLGRRRGISPNAMEDAGLVKPRSKGEGYYDRFRNRLMFPVRDRNHSTIGFGARALSEEDQPKYLNSPEGPLFNKRRCFYGFCEAREAIRTDKTAVIMEGYTDVIMAHQFGITSAIAVLGTSLTAHHARTLSNLCDRVILVFDADEAGQKSTARSIEVLLSEDLEPQVARLEAGEDPCEFLLEHGAGEFQARLEESENFLEFRLRRASEEYDMNTVNGRTQAFDDLLEVAMAVDHEAKRDMLVREIASELGVTEQSAFAYLEKHWSERSGNSPAKMTPDPAATERLSADASLPGELLGFLLAHTVLQQNAAEELELEWLQEGPDRRLLNLLLKEYEQDGPVSGGDFINGLDDPELIALATRRLEEERGRGRAIARASAEQRYGGYKQCLRQRKLQHEKRSILRPVEGKGQGAPEDEDERLRHYFEMRREEDKQSSRLNPRKES